MFNITIKDLKIFLTDRKAVILSFMLPIGLITLFAIAFGGVFKNDRQKPTTLLVADNDSTASSKAMINKIDSLKGIVIHNTGFEEGMDQVKSGKRIAVLVFYQGYQDSIKSGKTAPLELYYDPAREMQIGIIQQALIPTLTQNIESLTYKNKIKQSIKEKYGYSTELLAEINSQIDEMFAGKQGNNNVQPSVNYRLKTTKVIKHEKTNWGLIQAVAGISVMMLLFTVSAIGSSILEEKEKGTLKRILISPIQKHNILLGKLIFAVIFSTIQLIVMYIFTWLVFGLNILIDLPSLILMIVATAFACSSFGVFLAAICSTRKQVESLSTIVILVMSAIGGSMIPLFIMPSFMQKIAIISVNYWSINGFYDIFWRNLPFGSVALNALVLTCIGVVMSVISLFLFRRNVLKVL